MNDLGGGDRSPRGGQSITVEIDIRSVQASPAMISNAIFSAGRWLLSAALVRFGVWSWLAAAEKYSPQVLEQARNRMVDEEVIGAGIKNASVIQRCE